MTIPPLFAPQASRAINLDTRMHIELGASLAHVIEQTAGQLAFDHEALTRLRMNLAAGTRYPPPVFGNYYDLVNAILADDSAGAEAAFAHLAAATPARAEQCVVALGDPAIDPHSRQYHAKLSADMSPEGSIHPPQPEAIARFREQVRQAFDLLHAGAPELAGELAAIVREIIGVTGGPDDTMAFDGGSHFQLWGALFLNVEPRAGRVAMAEVIAHESAHSFLFGWCTEEPLVHNDDSERYPSPLRHDPRPMDGIYHATFVSARMHWTLTQLLDAGVLDRHEAAFARDARTADASNFAAGDAVVREHARLSEHGRALMDSARDWMARAAT